MGLMLLATLAVPVVGAILNDGDGRRMRWAALGTTLLTFALATVLIARFPGGAEEFAAFDVAWLGGLDSPAAVRFSIALDGLSLWLFGLTALLMVVAVLVSWEAVTQRAAVYYSLLLLLETGMLGVFVARDVILFYIFFEFTLIPLFFLIGIWGSDQRRYAAIKFFLFTFAGSVLTFLGLLAIVLWNYDQTGALTFSIGELTAATALRPIDPRLQTLIFLLLFAGFAIKVPLFPFHTWLPLAHVEAPTAGSVLLAGVLLKVGGYGFVRFALPMLPDAAAALMPLLLWLCVAGILYGALVTLVQDDIKRLIAYSSVSHLGFSMLGIFALNRLGMQGGVLQMVNHGLSTGGLFALVGMLYERYHTRQIKDYGGMARRLPVLAFFMVLFTLSSIGLPGLNGFAGEFLLLLGMFQRGWAEAPAAWSLELKAISVLATFGVVLGAWYMLSLVQRVFFGPLREPKAEASHRSASDAAPVGDLSPREVAALAPLVVLVFWIGLWPQFFLSRMAPTLDRITSRTAVAMEQRVAWEGVGAELEGEEVEAAKPQAAGIVFASLLPAALRPLAPEILLIVVAGAIYLGGVLVRARRDWSWLAIGGLIGATVLMATAAPAATGSSGPLELDGLTLYVRWLALGVGALLVLLAARPLAMPGSSEYLGSLLLVIAGMMLVAAARELVLLFVGLELVSIPTYVLLYLGRRDAASQEATAKYFYLSVLASAIFLYGLSFLYGATGSTDLGTIHQRLLGVGSDPDGLRAMVKVALVLIYAGLGFRIAAVPFHFYAPDVFQGTTHENAALLSVVPKIAGLAALARIVAMGMEPVEGHPWRIALILAVLTMTLGNVMALWQDNLRRLLAYSSIAHAGYLLIGLAAYLATLPGAAGAWDGLGAMFFYLLVYAVATIGTFAVLACLGRGDRPIEAVDELAGLGWTGGWGRPLLAGLLAVFLFSLTGIPPLAGFWGKFGLFASALSTGGANREIHTWFAGLAMIGVLNAAVSAGYYLRIVGAMFFRLPLATPRIRSDATGPFAVTLLCGLLTLLVGFGPRPWIQDANRVSPGRSWTRSATEQDTIPAGRVRESLIAQPLTDRKGNPPR